LGLLGGVRRDAAQHGNAVLLEQVSCLVLVEIHASSNPCVWGIRRRKPSRPSHAPPSAFGPPKRQDSAFLRLSHQPRLACGPPPDGRRWVAGGTSMDPALQRRPDLPPPVASMMSKLNWLRAGVLGANDGIVSTSAL